MRATAHWLSALLHERYCVAYWEAVARNEWWLRLMMELTADED